MKKYIIKSGFCLLAALLLLQGCKNEVVEKFDSESSLYFFNGPYSLNGGRQDGSVSYSFFYVASTVTQDSIWVDVRLNGFPSETDRTITLVQLNVGEDEAAVAGTHYIAFDDSQLSKELILPAGRTSVLIPIVIKKSPDMETSEFTLEFGFATNDNFVPGLKEYSTFAITMTAMAVKPPTWDSYYNGAFGEWGQEKMKFLIDHVGFTDFTISLFNNDIRKYYNMKARAILEAYEKDNGPIYEKDGVTKVIFP